MILALAATQIELEPFLLQWREKNPDCLTLITGVGPMETALRLSKFLCQTEQRIEAVVNFGIGGAYLQAGGYPQPELLDICLAEQEVVGDLGMCVPDGMEYLDPTLTGDLVFPLDPGLVDLGGKILTRAGILSFIGTFVTVSAASATRRRGEMLRSRWRGLCENMEGAAVARVCREFSIPCMELRAISNYVEDRNPQNWRLREACLQAAECAAHIVKGMSA